MHNVMKFIKSKGKLIFAPIVVALVLASIYVFNGINVTDTTIVQAESGTFIEASGGVESNLVTISSEVTGSIIEQNVKEGDEIKSGQLISKIKNTNLENQYEQAKINVQIAEKNVALIEDNIENFKVQSDDLVQQAKSAYLAAEAEYQRVKDGASPEEIQQAEEAVNQAKINFDYIKENLDKSRELLEQEVIPQSEYDEVEKNYKIAETQYNTANAKLNQIKSLPTDSSLNAAKNKMLQAKSGYELAISNGDMELVQLENQLDIAKIQLEQSNKAVEQAKVELEKTVIKAPIDGVVNSLFFDKGEFVSTGKPFAEIYDPNNIEIKAYVSEANIGHVKVGQVVEIFVDSHEGKPFNGKVTKINNEAEFTPKNIQTKEERVNTVFEVKIEVTDSNGIIKPGMPVDVNIKID